jgi:ATP-binding cassette subfamily B protein
MKRTKSKKTGRTALRLLSYTAGRHKALLICVFLCIIISAAAGVGGSMFVRILIDDYIAPMLTQANPAFTGLLYAILFMAVVYVVGIAATLLYNRLMVVVAQGTLKTIRDDMFSHMQTLPVKYFDTHTFGDVMSRYTNDTDTLRQMIAISLPQTISSVVTIVAVAAAMIAINIWLTLLVSVFVAAMLVIVKVFGGRSAKYFVRQQASIGDLI